MRTCEHKLIVQDCADCWKHRAECLTVERDEAYRTNAKLESNLKQAIEDQGDLQAEISRLRGELEGGKAAYQRLMDGYIELGTDRDRYKALAMKAKEALYEYGQHGPRCILSHWSAGEPTADGGYRTMYSGKWYQTKPIDETPKCECGFDDVFAAYSEKGDGNERG